MNLQPDLPTADARPWHAVDHAENFPVGSWLVPARLRPSVVAIYRFARHADDIADEGDAPVEVRLARLAALDDALIAAARVAGSPGSHGSPGSSVPVPIVAALIDPVSTHGLAWTLFHDLIDAFRQDLTVRRYPDAAAVDDYCRRSANPIGRLMLGLFDAATPANVADSDSICTALQRINFLQDIGIDHRKDRVYLPLDTLARHGLNDRTFAAGVAAGQLPAAARAAVADEATRARNQILSGRPLAARVPTRLGLELRFIVAGGLRILDRIAAAGHDPVAARPALGWRDGPALLRHALNPIGASPAFRPRGFR